MPYHVLGLVGDELLYEEKDERFNVGVEKSRDRKYLFVASASHTTSEVRYLTVPRRPAGSEDLDEEALAALVTRDSMVGVRTLG